MAENKTQPTEADVHAHLAAIENASVRADCQALVHAMTAWTGETPKMWGPSIVGYGLYHYTYDSGRTGVMCRTGFAARGRELVVYLIAESAQQQALLDRLGRHRKGKSCLYIKRLADVDLAVLETLVKDSLGELQRRHG